MRVLRQDAREGAVKLLLESDDDLWHLQNLIEPGDLVRATTYRREERRSDKLRPERGEKRRVRLGLRAERVEFQAFADHLRVGGPIEEGPEDLPGIGGHHTFTLGPGDEVEIVKGRWKDHQLRRIAEAVEASRRPLVTLVALDDEAALLAQMHEYGIEEVAEIPSRLGGKMYGGRRTKEEYFSEVLGKLEQVGVGEVVVLLGPGFEREGFAAYVAARRPDLGRRLHSYGTGHGGMQGIQEALRSGIADAVLRESRVGRETKAIEELFQGIARGGPVAYGPADVGRAAAAGAVDALLVTDQLLRTAAGEALLHAVEAARGRILVVSTHHEAGKRLQALGGAGALLRFRLPGSPPPAG